MSIAFYALIAAVVLAIIFIKMTVVIIPQSETKIIERLGKYFATLKPGINIIIPFIDRPKTMVSMYNGRYVYTTNIDLREQVYDFDRQNGQSFLFYKAYIFLKFGIFIFISNIRAFESCKRSASFQSDNHSSFISFRFMFLVTFQFIEKYIHFSL